MKIEICPLCSYKEHHTLYSGIVVEGKTYDIVQCDACGHKYTFFREEEDVDKFYDGKDYTVRDTRTSVFHRIQSSEYRRVLKKLNGMAGRQRLLDFGSGKGVFLSFAKPAFQKVYGVETSEPRAAYARDAFGVEVKNTYYKSGQLFEERFDVITMFHVLEHIPGAFELLNNLLKDNLADDGAVVIEVPNIGSWQSKWAKSRWLHIDVPRHVSHFSDDSLDQLTGRLGFEVVARQTFSLHLGIIGMTQTVMVFFGYKGFLIGDLKKKKSLFFKWAVLALLPLATVLELLAAAFKKGGVLRYYLKKKDIKS